MPETAPARPRVSSGAVFFDDDGRVLLVDPTYKDFWNLPGGAVDAGESPREACIREVREELGLSVPIGALLVAAWTPGKLYFVFDGGTLTPAQRAAIVLSPGELAAHEFVGEQRAKLLLAPALWPLMGEILRARADGTTRYVEIS
ncbi:NUDIX domain-containing protein [Couchioplanes azureus]|uniref:NUDIX domain-containing protein n=1 Tax=Couchioplanes caeruleus TaxID=56438 RepID=UPI001670E843|nr:NUDIX hydrolase [Couchioplanes caeruleus]GGQ79518.1 hypothetical protein GCM10010166_56910 [Couchioplanes caeruleus subsp. azureus]